jgi:hypothetical protein
VTALFQALAARIRDTVPDLGHVVQRASQAWPLAQQSRDEPNVHLDSVALNLHSFYSGLERLFELIARHVDGNLPAGTTWHRHLLQQMVQDLTDVRPAVISQNNAQILDEFRRFRHVVRHAYTMQLVPDRMVRLMTNLPALWPRLRAELLAFADFLDDLATSSQTE